MRLLVVVLIAAAAVIVALQWDQFSPAALRVQFAQFGLWAPLVFLLVFVLAGTLFVPATPLTLAAGMLFGPWLGALLALAGALLSALLGFLIARYLAADWARARLGPKLERVMAGVEEEGWRFVVFVRLVPVFHFSLLNFALGLTRIGWRPYVVASLAAMLPGSFAYAYLGHMGAGGFGGEDWLRDGLLALGLLTGLVFLPRLLRRCRGQAPSRRSGDRRWRLLQPAAHRCRSIVSAGLIPRRRGWRSRQADDGSS